MNVSGYVLTPNSEDVDICGCTEFEIVLKGSAVSFNRVQGQSKIPFDPEPGASGFIAGNLGVSFPSDFGHWKHPRFLDVKSSQRSSSRRRFSFESSSDVDTKCNSSLCAAATKRRQKNINWFQEK